MTEDDRNGSRLWDIAFIAQAIVGPGLATEEPNRASCVKALGWLDLAQIKGNTMHYGKDYRHQGKRVWPFSTPAQSYTVSDCTAEGLKAVLYLQEISGACYCLPTSTAHGDSDQVSSFTPKLISKQRMHDIILSLHNSDGGFASYELIWGP